MYKRDFFLVPVNIKLFTCLFFMCTGVITLPVLLLLCIGEDLSLIPIT